MRITDLSSGQDINKLKQLLAAGVITNDDLNQANISGSFGPVQGTQNALQDLQSPGPQDLQPQQPQEPPAGSNYVQNMQTGHITYITPQGPSDRPTFGATVNYQGGGAPPGGSAYTGSTRMMPQKQQDGPPVTRVLGSGAGTTVDLGAAGQQESVRPPLASGRNPIDIPGAGRGYYGTDGNAYVPNGDGSWTKVLLGYDMQGSMALNKANTDLAEKQAQIAHTNEQIRASKVNNPDVTTAGGGTPLNMSVTGNAFMQQLDPMVAQEVKAIGDGQTPFNPRSQRQMNLLGLVQQYNPNWSATDYQARQATTKDFATGGKSGQVVQAINQALHHAATVSDAIDALGNSDTLPAIINPIRNTFDQKILGDTRQGNFQTAAMALSEELKKIYAGGGGGSLAELQHWQQAFDPNAGQAQQKSYLAQGMNLLQGAIQSRQEAYQRGMGPSADFGKLFTPQALEALQKLQSKGYIGGAPQASTQTQSPQTPNIPAQAIAFLRSNPAARYDFDRKYGQGMAAQVLGQ